MSAPQPVVKSIGTVAAMFNGIAPRYDALNHLLSLGIDRLWRRRLVRQLAQANPQRVLDVATGTADLAIALARRVPQAQIEGVDIAEAMLGVGRQKLQREGFAQRVNLQCASAMALPFADAHFDAAMVAFGVRNFERLEQGLAEMARVVRPGGRLLVLEFSMPRYVPFRQLYTFYFRRVLPVLGGIVSGHRQAYDYLPSSVLQFPQGEEFVELMRRAGLAQCTATRLTMGVATLYSGWRG